MNTSLIGKRLQALQKSRIMLKSPKLVPSGLSGALFLPAKSGNFSIQSRISCITGNSTGRQGASPENAALTAKTNHLAALRRMSPLPF